jgi:hypothetical protein
VIFGRIVQPRYWDLDADISDAISEAAEEDFQEAVTKTVLDALNEGLGIYEDR